MHALVIGAGVIGLSSAVFLAERGVHVTVIDRDSGPALATSYANGGLLTPSMSDPWNAPGLVRQVLRNMGREDSALLIRAGAFLSALPWLLQFVSYSTTRSFRQSSQRNLRLALYSLQVLSEVERRLQLNYDQKSNGTLKVFRDNAALTASLQVSESLAPHGLRYSMLDRDRTVEREPALAPIAESIHGSLYYPDDRSGDAHLFSLGLTKRLRKLGATLLFDVTALDWHFARGRIRHVATSMGPMAADTFLLAAASASPHLTRRAGFRLPIAPLKGYSITLPAGHANDMPSMAVVDDALHAAVTPLGNRIRVAGTAEVAGFDIDVSPARIRLLLAQLKKIYPLLHKDVTDVSGRGWAGLRPASADGVPVVGRTPIENLFINTGHGHLGWTLACGSARAVADLMLDTQPEIVMSDYDIGRFKMKGGTSGSLQR